MLTTQVTTREALLRAAGELLERVGYASFSYRDLAEVVGIRTASIHYYFPTKEDLGVAWADWYQEQMLERERHLCAEWPDVRQRLQALAECIAERMGSGSKSCPISILQAEFAVLPARVQAAVRALVEQRLGLLSRWLEEGRHANQLRFPGRPETQAVLVWSVLEHGSQLERSRPSCPLPVLVRQLVDTMSL